MKSVSYLAQTHKEQRTLNEVIKKMEIEVKESMKILDGKHEGIVTEIRYREQPFPYTDFVLEFEEGKKVITGVPTSLTIDSKLGKILVDFGASLEVGGTVDPEKVMIGKKCSFMTMTSGKYANVVQGSLRCIE
jgi:hypothetical protein